MRSLIICLFLSLCFLSRESAACMGMQQTITNLFYTDVAEAHTAAFECINGENGNVYINCPQNLYDVNGDFYAYRYSACNVCSNCPPDPDSICELDSFCYYILNEESGGEEIDNKKNIGSPVSLCH